MAAGVAGARLPLLRASPATAPRSVAATGDPLYLGMMSCRCAPPTIAAESGNGSMRCGGGWQAPYPSSRRNLPVRASHFRGRVQ